MIQNFVRSTLSLTFVIAAACVVFNIKARMARETSWQLELKGDLTKQRRVEAVDKLLSVMTLLVSLVFGLQAIGLDGEQRLSPSVYLMCSGNTQLTTLVCWHHSFADRALDYVARHEAHNKLLQSGTMLANTSTHCICA